MRVAYLIAGTYRSAGMERVLASKANWLISHEYEVIIVTTDQRGRKPAFEFDPRIRHYDLGVNYEINNGKSFFDKLSHYPFKLIAHRRKLKTLLTELKPDITVSMFCNDVSFVPGIKDGSKKVLEVHFCRSKRLQYERRGIWALADRLRNWLDALYARRYDRFVVLTDEDKTSWGNIPGIQTIPNARTFCFDNPVLLDSNMVLAAGRYCYQKNFESLVDAWSRIDPSIRNGWILRIAGDGEQRQVLEQLIENLSIQDSVALGPSDNMSSLYERASVFALTSRYEGLPVVILEAQAAGIPIVSYECKCGPRDVITNDVDGFLVKEGDVDGMAASLSILMTDDKKRKDMGMAAFSASSRYDEERIMSQWVQLFNSLCLK